MLVSWFVLVGWVYCPLVFVFSLDFQTVGWLSVFCFISLFNWCLHGRMFAGVGGWGGGQGSWRLVYGIHRRGVQEEGKLQLAFCCSARDDLENWVLGNKESRKSLWVTYLVFCQADMAYG